MPDDYHCHEDDIDDEKQEDDDGHEDEKEEDGDGDSDGDGDGNNDDEDDKAANLQMASAVGFPVGFHGQNEDHDNIMMTMMMRMMRKPKTCK